MKTRFLAPVLAFAPFFAASCASTPAEDSTSPASNEIESEVIPYEADGVSLTGYLARPADRSVPAPGVLIVHEWWGHNDYVRSRADQLAELGYVAFALDMYGTGKTASHPENATAFMQEVMGNAPVMEARFRAALSVLNAQDGVNPKKTGAIGYCMGGGIALKMARETSAIDAVASFHGSLGAAVGAKDAGGLSHVLIATGGADPFVPAETVAELEDDLMQNASIENLRVMVYPDALHGFTNPAATAKGEEFDLPLLYDENADQKSWEALKAMLAEAL